MGTEQRQTWFAHIVRSDVGSLSFGVLPDPNLSSPSCDQQQNIYLGPDLVLSLSFSTRPRSAQGQAWHPQREPWPPPPPRGGDRGSVRVHGGKTGISLGDFGCAMKYGAFLLTASKPFQARQLNTQHFFPPRKLLAYTN